MFIIELISTQLCFSFGSDHKIVCVIWGGLISNTEQSHEAAKCIHGAHVSEWYSNILKQDIIEIERRYRYRFLREDQHVERVFEIHRCSENCTLDFTHCVLYPKIRKSIWNRVFINLSKVHTNTMTYNTVYGFLFNANNIRGMRRLTWPNHTFCQQLWDSFISHLSVFVR